MSPGLTRNCLMSTKLCNIFLDQARTQCHELVKNGLYNLLWYWARQNIFIVMVQVKKMLSESTLAISYTMEPWVHTKSSYWVQEDLLKRPGLHLQTDYSSYAGAQAEKCTVSVKTGCANFLECTANVIPSLGAKAWILNFRTNPLYITYKTHTLHPCCNVGPQEGISAPHANWP